MSKKDTSYELCKKKNINKIMKLYESKKLIIRKKKITSPKQAIAIALQQSEQNCSNKMTKTDIKNIQNKISMKNGIHLKYSDLKRMEILFSKKKDSKKLYAKIIHFLLYNQPIKKSY